MAAREETFTLPPGIAITRARALTIVIIIALAVFVAAFAADWRLPGLYMDAINPEYIIPGIFDHDAPGNHPWILPGNLILSRFPLFTGTIYHGSTQIYFALPLMAIFGVDVGTLRIAQGMAGFLIVLLAALYAGRSGNASKSALAASAMVPLALDPSFVVALRTQAYSCLFPMMLLLGSMLLLRDWQAKPASALRLLLSGVLYGLSVFSYFIFSFFFPALLWMLLVERTPGRSRGFGGVALWLFACGLGYFPVIGGLFRIAQAMGGFDAMVRVVRKYSIGIHALGGDSGALDRMLAVFTAARGVVTGRWPWLMVLQHHSGDIAGSLKAGLLVAVPLLVLALTRGSDAAERRAIRAPLIFVASFLACASIFGDRLDGHHYTTLLPFLYAAFGVACATLWEISRRNAGNGSRMAIVSATTIIALLVAVAGLNVFNLAHFHHDLEESGGVGLYSDAIDRFSLGVARNDADATVYFPDWGYVMPFVFLTRARVAQLDSVDPRRIARETCQGKPQIVLFAGTANAGKFDVVTQLAEQPSPTITDWTQRDGRRVFQSARYAPRADCEGKNAPPPAAPVVSSDVPSITITPDASSDCPFLSPLIATVRWDAGNPAISRTQVWVTPVNGKPQMWSASAQRGEDKTGQWAQPGMKFTLIDPLTAQHLAETRINAIACPQQ